MGECLDKALQLVARRPHFRRELEQKLSQRGFPAAEVESALAELERQGWLDDRAHANDLATGSMARKGFGPRRIRFELQRRGVDQELVEEVVGGIFEDPETELAHARQLARRMASGSSADVDRLARHLDRKGYSKGVILKILSEASGE